MDEALKFHLAWLLDGEVPSGVKVEEEKSLGYTPPASADVTNIGLTAVRALGFPLPTRPDEGAYTLFLKFFQYPTLLGHEASVRQATAPFLLGGMAAEPQVAAMIKSTGGVVVKMGVIEKTATGFGPQHPFPALKVPTGDVHLGNETLTAQQYFDRRVAFASVYVLGRADDQKDPLKSAGAGVAAYAADAMAVMARTYREVTGPDPKYAYFLDDSERDQAGSDPWGTLVRVARTPQVFDNWQALPMPQDAAHTFLGSLLLLFRDDYRLPAAAVTAAADLKGAPLRSGVFEVGGVVHRK